MRKYTRAEMEQVYNRVLGVRMPGMGAQGIRDLSTAQRYEIGSRLEMPAPDYRVFHYCEVDIAHTNVVSAGIANGDTLHFMNCCPLVAGVVGDRAITVVIDPADVAGYVRDQFRGGSITIHTAPIQIVYSIIGNDPDDGTNVLLRLGEPLIAAVALNTFSEIHENQYNSTVPMTGAGDQSVVAVPLMPVPINNFFWGQTWGKCICAAAVGGGIGAVVNEASVYFQDDGSIGAAPDLLPASGFQHAGYIIPTTSRLAANADSLYFMLQLDP